MENIRKRRDRHEIVTEILESARGGTKKTHIMYSAKLSYRQINYYMTLLVEKGFLEKLTIPKRRQVYCILKTSELGERFIQNFRTLDMQ